MNKVYLIGNLTRDPELSETSSNVPFCRFAIAVNRPFANSEGNREVDYFNIIVWRGLAENCGRFLKKGSKVAVVGSIQNRTYEVEGAKRTATDIVASEVEFLSTNRDDAPIEPIKPVKSEKPGLTQIEDDGLPF
jgi:single-strand DNA-binding protein